jgi:hypothetical protein
MTNFLIVGSGSPFPDSPGRGSPATYSIEAAAELVGIHPELVRYYCSRGFLGAVSPDKPVFDDDAIYELRRIEHYRRHHGVSRRALPVISELLREVQRLEAELRFRGYP